MLSVLILGLSALAVAIPAPRPAPTGIPTASKAMTELAAITVAAAGSQDGYGMLDPEVLLPIGMNMLIKQ